MNEVKKKPLQEPVAIEKITNYFKGVRAEWDKIIWPEKTQVIRETIIVLIVVVFFTTFVFCLDVIYEWLFKLIGFIGG